MKPYIAALTACAALAGGGQLLLPAPAGAMVSNGPGCGQSWFDQFVVCIDSTQPGGGGGPGNGGGGAVSPAPPEKGPDCDEKKGNYCISSDGPKKEETHNPPVIIDGSPGRPTKDHDAGQGGRDEGRAHGVGRKPRCEAGKKSNGCVQIKCLVKVDGVEKVEFVDDKLECQKRRWEAGDETPEDRKQREKLCDSLYKRVKVNQAIIRDLDKKLELDDLDKQLETATLEEVEDRISDLKRRRARRNVYVQEDNSMWNDKNCWEFSFPKLDEGGSR